MRDWPVTIVSAYGRGETLALALHENGYQVQILDFTPAFGPEYQRGCGPFPIANKTHLPAQRDFLRHAKPVDHGLSLWLKEGPLDLSGPMSAVHLETHPELKAMKKGGGGKDFSVQWLNHWVRQWASSFHSESWSESLGATFPYEERMGLIPAEEEARVMGFTHFMAKGLNVRQCSDIHEVRVENSRLQELVVDCGSRFAAQAKQWIWCLSSFETKTVNREAAEILFWRGVLEPDWAWLSFEVSLQEGPWCEGLPGLSVVIGDVFLPWVHANMFVLRRTERTRYRVWLKVPRSRAHHIDSRRGWSLGVENILRARLPLADWRVEAADWSLCPHSEVYSGTLRGRVPGQWKNWDWISPETMPRLDFSARLEREAESFERLQAWRNDQLKKQGVPRDHALHTS